MTNLLSTKRRSCWVLTSLLLLALLISPASAEDTAQQQQTCQNIDGQETCSRMSPSEAVAAGDIRALRYLAETNPKALLQKDANGWSPFHEACRMGQYHLDIVDFFLKHGANLNEKAGLENDGKLPFEIARESLGPEHPITVYLTSHTQLTQW